MTFLSRILPGRKDNPAGPIIAKHVTGKVVATPRRYDKLADEGYVRNIVAYRCVSLISNNASAVPWQVFNSRTKKEFEDHPLLDLLRRPNPITSGPQFFEEAYGFFLLAGNDYIVGVGPEAEGEPPEEMWNLRPDRMRIVAGSRGMPEAYVYEHAGAKIAWDVDQMDGTSEVLHTKTFHPLDDWYGLSPLEPAASDIDQHNESGVWNLRLLQNSAAPSGYLVYAPKGEDASETLSDEQRESIKDALEERYSGAERAGRPMVLEGGLDWKQTSMSPRDMDWLKGSDKAARDIAQAFNVPAQLVGIEGSQTYANFEQATMALYDDAVIPLLDLYREQLNRWLAPTYGEDIVIRYDKDEIDGLAPRRQQTWEKVKNADWLTINEKRKETGFEDIEGGDVLLVDSNKLPLLGDDAPEDLPLEPVEGEEGEEGDDTPEERRRRFELAYGDGPS